MKALKLATFGLLLIGFSLSMTQTLNAQTKLMSQPALSDTHISFIYAEDLWVANRDGSNPIRLTIDEGIESTPVFSPDGSTIAFNAQYDGNTDVYTIPVTGGIPKRLTWHPYPDSVRDFSADGKSVLFLSQRNTHTNRYSQLYTVSVTGGAVTQLPIPNAFWASYSDNDKFIAYTPLPEAFTQWKHYRGGRVSTIWVYDTKTHKVVEVPKPASGSNDSQPKWMGNDVYFKSDRDGEFNLFSYDLGSKTVEKLTDYKDFPIENLSTHNGAIIFEQAGVLHIYDTQSKNTERLSININTDLLELRERFVSGSQYLRSGDISPSGARVVVDFRGDIITVPAEKGDPRNITETTGIHEKFPAWSPDGATIAYFSDASGEYALHLKDMSTNAVTSIPLKGTGFYAEPHWSPDSKKVAFVDNGRNLYVTDITSKKTTKIAQDIIFTPGDIRDLFGSWSHDSNWVSYTIITATNFEQAYLYSLNDKKSHELSDGLSNVSEPVFDPSGKYIYMLASTDAGPLVNWFDQSNIDKELTHSVYLVTLRKDIDSPLAKESDEETPKASGDVEEKKEEKKEETDLKIDWDGIQNRIITLPIQSGVFSSLSLAKEGELFYLSLSPHTQNTSLKKFSLKTKKSEEITPASIYGIASGGKKMWYQNGRSWYVSNLGAKSKEAPINFNAIRVKINPKDEWENIFDEAWRVNRDYFYDPGMHGVNWNAMKTKYKAFLPHVATRSDLYRVMQWMFSELSVGHHRFSSRGDRLNNPQRIGGGLLGANYIIKNNRYQIEKIFGGLNWTPNLRSPLTEPGINVNKGDYIIAVNGKNLTAKDNIYSFFENTVNKIVELKVSRNANGSDSKTIKVTPLSNEFNIRNRDWVEGNMKRVHEATDGQVAYVYVPNTTVAGFQYFKRYFYPQADKKAIIVDERYNGGGSLADYYIDILKRPEQSYWNFRYGKDFKAPSASIQGPKVLITDEMAGSGGDYFPYLWRKFNVGTIVGKRTWGGLVGVLGYPEFIDGGIVTAPNVAFYDERGFKIENEGVAPDIEIEQWPEQVINGKDPQLEKAIELALKGLKENPPKKVKTPAYPDKTKN